MKTLNFEVGDLLYNLNHGLVRVARILNNKNEAGDKVVTYSLSPCKSSVGKVRFVASMAALETSGFHELATEDEANQVLQYLRNRIVAAPVLPCVSPAEFGVSHTSQLENLARSLLSFCFESFDEKDRTNKLQLNQAAKGLIGELSYSFKITTAEMVAKMKDILGGANMNPLVRMALERL